MLKYSTTHELYCYSSYAYTDYNSYVTVENMKPWMVQAWPMISYVPIIYCHTGSEWISNLPIIQDWGNVVNKQFFKFSWRGSFVW